MSLKFVYWRHRGENVGFTVPHLLGAQAIAVELAGRSGLDTGQVEGVFDLINTDWERVHAAYTNNGPTGDEAITQTVQLVEKIRSQRAGKAPLIFPVDAYAHFSDQDDIVSLYRDLVGSDIASVAERRAENMRFREQLVLRQLYEQSVRMSKELRGGQCEIAVLSGNMHSLTSVAARNLGANVTRVFVRGEQPARWPVQVLLRHIRLGGEGYLESDQYKELAARAQRATNDGLILGFSLHQHGTDVDWTGGHAQRALTWLAWRSAQGILPPRVQKEYTSAAECVAAAALDYANEERRPRWWQPSQRRKRIMDAANLERSLSGLAAMVKDPQVVYR